MCFVVDHSLKHANVHLSRAEHLFKDCFPRSRRTIATAIQIERRCAEFRIGVAGEMRLGEQSQTTDTAWIVKLVPCNIAEHVEIEIAYHTIENCTQTIEIRKR